MSHKRMKNLKKLGSNRGATLLEVIISILIFSMATLSFYQMVFVSVSVNQAAGLSDSKLEEQRLIAESYGAYRSGDIDGDPAQLRVSAGGVSKTITVHLYGDDENAAISYKLP